MEIARLVFDSWRTGNPVGTRGGNWEERTLLFRAGNVCVDLILQDQAASDAFACGQVLDEEQGLPVSGAQVQLGRSGSRGTTDELGQFLVTGSFDHDIQPLLTIRAPAGVLHCEIPPVT